MKTIFYSNFLFLSLLIISCSIQINGLTNDYNKLNPEEKELISKLENFEELENGKIYQIHAEQLKNEIKTHPKALVYVFTNGCTTKLCLPMNVYINYAETNGYQLYLVMNGFSNLKETMNQDADTPYFAIDNEYYGVSFRTKYSNYFENELMDLPKETRHKNYPGNLYFFENGDFKNITLKLPKN